MSNILTAIFRGDKTKLANAVTSKNVDTRDEDGRTPLMHAVLAAKSDPDIVRLLIDRGADVNAADKKGWTALHFAAQAGNAELVRTLLESGAKPDPRDSDGATPLWRNLMSSTSMDIVRALVEAGADPNANDKTGTSSPLSLAQLMGNKEAEDLMLKSGGKG